jgi:murein DD-endopeptidase MepM/ murein hydrolase activator NlpD
VKPSPIARRRRRVAAAGGTAIAALALGAAEAGAASGGGGAVGAPAPPEPRDVTCASTCAGPRTAVVGSTVVVTGHHLGGVTRVLFKSASGPRIPTTPTDVAGHSVQAAVPQGAASGRPAVGDSFGNSVVIPVSLRITDRVPATSGFKLAGAAASPRKAYYDGRREPAVRYMFSGSQPLDVRVSVLSVNTGATVASFLDAAAEPNTENLASWNGLTSTGDEPPGGSYRFAIVPAAGGTPASTANSAFSYHRYKFPVRGRHTYGDGVGAPRSGHVHEGQDVMAACGTPIVAARGGRVQWRDHQSAAGNYLVIDGKGTGRDYAYMHLAQPSRLRKGQRVHTGQRLGVVGKTGDASACHLHFEEWSAPGWYEGGHYLRSVTRDLKRWDTWS